MGNVDFRDPNVQIAGMVVLVSVIIAYVFFLSGFLPFGYKVRGEAISSLESEYESLTADLMKAKQTASRLPQVRSEHEELKAKWEEAKNMLPTQKEVAELLSQVTVAGQRAGVEFLLFEPKAAVPREIYMENPIDVTVQGGFHQIGAFLERLSNLPRIVNVQSVDLKNVANPISNELPDVVQASMSLTSYTLLTSENRNAALAQANQPASRKGGQRGRH